jgi:GNAT superfamily N-acetyltransferase
MQVIEVNNASAAKDFLKVNVLMNKHNPNYIRPLDHEIYDVFDATKNKHLRHGEIKRWILKNDKGELIGRVAAFTNSKYINKGTEFPTGGVGFFDCIHDQSAANKLFDVAKEWLQSKGMEAMDGPINLGDRDKWWGLLVEGFDIEPIYGMAFNPDYYEQLFFGYGFENYYNQYYYLMDVDIKLPPKFAERHAKFKAKPGYEAKHISIKNLERHAGEFATVYNAAWAQHGEAKEISKEQVMKLFNKMKLVMDERMIWFAYYKEEPIAMWVNIPDLNQFFKHFNGKFGLIEKLRLLWMKKTGQCKKATGVAFGVVPKYQALGIDSFMIQECALMIQGAGWYDTYEMGWAGDWNPKMINIYKSLGAQQSRRLITFRYLFDRSKPFERHPELDYKQI